jgi:hypothetical protein
MSSQNYSGSKVSGQNSNELFPDQQEEQLRPLGLANEAKLFQITKSVSLSN